MKNLKRVLSLVLALMMALSLMAFSSSASAAESATIPVASDYNDYNEVSDDYKEAADVTVALGIIKGKTDTSLDPEGTLTRAEAVIMIMRILLGDTAAESMSGSNSRIFLDVGAEFPYGDLIAYAANTGIVSGDAGSKKFFPSDTLNVVSFGKILLGALGYDGEKEGYTGATWYINVFADMATAGIDLDGVTDPFANLTREQAMQMTFQALKSPLVEYPTVTISQSAIATKNGASYVTSTVAKNQYISDKALTGNYIGTSAYLVEFAEKYLQKLVLNDTVDAFGRPTHTWILNNVQIGEYDDYDRLVAEYDSETTNVKIAADLGSYYVDAYKNSDYYDTLPVNDYTKWDNESIANANGNGRINIRLSTIKNNSSSSEYVLYTNSASASALNVGTEDGETIAQHIAGLTGNGKKVEVYVDENNIISNIVVINYAVGTLNIARPVTNDRYNYAVTNAKWAQWEGWTSPLGTVTTLTGSEFDSEDVLNTIDYSAFTEQNIEPESGMVVTCAQIDNVLYIYPTTDFTGAQTSKTNVLNTVDTVTVNIDGTSYTLGTSVNNVDPTDYMNSKNTATYYLDQYGYVVYSNKTSLSYAYVVAAGGWVVPGVDGNTPVIQARVVLEDQSVDVYNVSVTKKSSGWYITNTNTKLDVTDSDTVAASARTVLVGGLSSDDGQTAANYKKYTVWDYTVDGDKITLNPIDPVGSTSLPTKGSAYYGTSTTDIKKGDNQRQPEGSTVKLLMDAQTVYIIYNPYTQTAAKVVGNTNLSSNQVLKNAKMIAVATKTGSTSEVSYLVFATLYGEEAAKVDYAYINVDKGVTIQNNGTTEFTGYTHEDPAEKIYLTDTTKNTGSGIGNIVNESGVYEYNTETNEVTRKLASVTVGEIVSQNMTFKAAATLSVTGTAGSSSLIDAGGKLLNIAGVSVYVDVEKGSEDGAYGYAIYDKDGTLVTIYIVPGVVEYNNINLIGLEGNDINKVLESGTNVKFTSGTVPAGIKVPEGRTLTIGSGATVGDTTTIEVNGGTLESEKNLSGKTITLNDGTLVLGTTGTMPTLAGTGGEVRVQSGTTTASSDVDNKYTITVEKDATLALESGLTILPAVTGEGTVAVNTNVNAATPGENDLDALCSWTGVQSATISGNVENSVTVARNPLKLTGTGLLLDFNANSEFTMAHYISDVQANGSTNLGLYKFTITGLKSGDTVTGKRYVGNTGVGLNGAFDPDGDGFEMDADDDLDIVLLEGDKVTKIVFTVTPSAGEEYTITFNING